MLVACLVYTSSDECGSVEGVGFTLGSCSLCRMLEACARPGSCRLVCVLSVDVSVCCRDGSGVGGVVCVGVGLPVWVWVVVSSSEAPDWLSACPGSLVVRPQVCVSSV